MVIGVGFLVGEFIGSMVVDIGGGIIEVVVIFLGGIVISCFVRIVGDDLDEVIINYICKKYNLLIGDCIVEVIKMEIGLVSLNGLDLFLFSIWGCDLVIGFFKIIEIILEEISEVFVDIVVVIIDVVKGIFENMLLELLVDIMDKGIVFIGGGVFLCNLDIVIFEEIKMFVIIVDELFDCVVIGIGKVLENMDMYKCKKMN